MDAIEVIETLCGLLRGEVRAPADWMPVVAAANHGNLTPALYEPLKQWQARGGDPPADLMVFVEDVEARNARRNDLLLAQLEDGALALNRAGITPILFKGGALTLTDPAYHRARLLTDNDLLIRPEEVEPALAALVSAGIPIIERYPGADVHCVAELGRRGVDPGQIDLHQRAAGPPAAAEIPDLRDHCRIAAVGKARVLLPSPAILAFLTMLHDQFHDGDFWRGALDLRHLMDFARLCEQDFDFDHFDALCRTRLMLIAAHAQLIAAAELMGARIPDRIAKDPAARFHYRRSRLQHRAPRLMSPIGLLTVLIEAPSVLAHRRFDRAGRASVLTENARAGPRGGRLNRLRNVFTGVKTGKL